MTRVGRIEYVNSNGSGACGSPAAAPDGVGLSAALLLLVPHMLLMLLQLGFICCCC
jgi:hypothetical protein